MTMPAVVGPAVTSVATAEEDLVAVVASLCGPSGADMLSPSGASGVYTSVTYPAAPSTVWLSSTGESGYHHLVGAVNGVVGSRQMYVFVGGDINASDPTNIDPIGIGGGAVYGVTNHDPTLSWPATEATHLTSGTYWLARDATSAYEYWGAANKDFVVLWVQYLSGGAPCQGIIYIGIPSSDASERGAYRYCRSVIQSMTAPVGGIVNVTLRHQIHDGAGLPIDDGTVYPDDTYPIYLQFQSRIVSLATEPGGDNDFGLVERIAVTNLSAAGGVTSFDIDVTGVAGANGAKLRAAGARYASGRGAAGVNGVGDLVSLFSEPTIGICHSRNNGTQLDPNNGGAIMAWAAYGFQGVTTSGYCRLVNAGYTSETQPEFNAPSVISGLPIPMYVRVLGNPTKSHPVWSDNENYKSVGVLPGIICVPHMPTPEKSLYRLDADDTKKYRKANFTVGQGLRRLSNEFGSGAVGRYYDHLIGPGWINP